MNLGTFLAGFAPGIMTAQQQIEQRRAERERTALMQAETAARLQQMRNDAESNRLFTGELGNFLSPGGTPQSGISLPSARTQVVTPVRDLVAKYESGGNPNVGYGGEDLSNAPRDQYGFPQWGGKMGPAGISHAAGLYGFQPGTWRRYAGPLGITDFSKQSQDRVFEAARAKEGMRPWESNTKLMAALREGPPDPSSEVARVSREADASRADGNFAGGSGQEVDNLVRGTMQAIPQDVRGKMSADALMGAIHRIAQDQNASDAAKMSAIERLQKFMSPMMQQQYQQQRDELQREWRSQERAQDRQFRIENETRLEGRRARERKETAGMDWHPYQDGDGTRFVYNPKTQEARTFTGGQPYQVKDPQRAMPIPTGSTQREGQGQNIRIADQDGKVVFSGAAHPAPGAAPGESAWIDDRTQQRLIVPEGGALTITGKGDPGKQAAAQMLRLTGAASEARRQIANVSRVTQGTTTSWFQGLQAEQAGTLKDALGRTLANQLTPRDAQVMSVIGLGLGRSLASLETAGAATGLVQLMKSMEKATPAAGDDRLTALVKIAEMRQIAEAGIESAEAAPGIGSEQKKLLESVRSDIAKAVPWTVPDVIDMMTNPGEDSYHAFAGKLGLGQGQQKGSAAQSGVPPREAIDVLRQDPSPERRKQFDEVFGAGASAGVLGQ